MRHVRRTKLGRLARGTALAAALLLGTAAAASAHTPVEIDSHDVAPWSGPLILNGENPVNLFGVLPRAGTIRSAQMHMKAGKQLSVSLIIPDQAPENQLTTGQLPSLLLVTPDWRFIPLNATQRVPIHLENGRTLIKLGSYAETAVAGTYSLVAVGSAPERFSISLGVEGEPFEGLQRGTVATPAQLGAWFNTPPTG